MLDGMLHGEMCFNHVLFSKGSVPCFLVIRRMVPGESLKLSPFAVHVGGGVKLLITGRTIERLGLIDFLV